MRLMKLLVALLSTFAATTANAQVVEEWVFRYNSPFDANEIFRHVKVDQFGNIIAAGTADQARTSTSPGDYLVVKLDPNGQMVWDARYDGPVSGIDTITAMDVDQYGNIYVTGRSEQPNDTGTGSLPEWVTIKYSPDGAMLWLRRLRGSDRVFMDFGLTRTNQGIPEAMVVSSQGNVYVTGHVIWQRLNESDVWVNHGRHLTTIAYDTDGSLLWAQRHSGTGVSSGVPAGNDGHAVAISPAGVVFAAGRFGEPRPGGLTSHYATIRYFGDGWVRKYAHVFPEEFEGHHAQAIAVDTDGSVYVTGRSWGGPLGSAGTRFDIATLKYSPAGDLLWERRYDVLQSGQDEGIGIRLDHLGNIHVLAITTNPTGGAGNYLAILKYDPEGNLLWTAGHRATFPNVPNVSSTWQNAIALDGSGNVYVTSPTPSGSATAMHTARYDADGDEVWSVRFDGGGTTNSDNSFALALGPGNSIYVAGYLRTSATWNDGIVIKYTQADLGNTMPVVDCPHSETAQADSGDGKTFSLNIHVQDPDGDPLAVVWNVAGIDVRTDFVSGADSLAGTTLTLEYDFPLGTSDVTINVSDGVNAPVICSADILVYLDVEGFGNPLANLILRGTGDPPYPQNAFRINRVLPLRLNVLATSGPLGGGEVAPPRIVGLSWEDDPLPLTVVDPGAGEGEDAGIDFQWTDEQWMYRLGTRTLSPGNYLITIQMPDGRRWVGAFALR